MKGLKSVMIGICVPILLIPLSEFVINIAGTAHELVCLLIAKHIITLKQELGIEDDDSCGETHAIGFQIPNKEFEDDDEEYEDE